MNIINGPKIYKVLNVDVGIPTHILEEYSNKNA